MKKTLTIKALVAIMLVAASTACDKELDTFTGNEVKFGVRTELSSLTLTKTNYSGIVNSSQEERINWENTDLIRIFSDQVSEPAAHYSDYSITLDRNENKFSYAKADPYGSSHGLQWGDGSHTFYGLYPAPVTVGVPSGLDITTSGSNAVITATLPADQSIANTRTNENDAQYYGDMRLAYMAAATTGASPGTNVTLSFTPIVTTFYVTISNTTGAPMTLKEVRLTSSTVAMTGTFKTTVTPADARSYEYYQSGSYVGTLTKTADNCYVKAAFSSGLSLAANESVTVALFALPQTIYNLTLTVTADETGPVSLLMTDTSDNPLAFTGVRKHNLNNIGVPPVSYNITVDKSYLSYDESGDVTDDLAYTVTSTKTIGGGTHAAPWKTQIWIDSDDDAVVDDDEWVDMTSSNRPAWISNFPLNSTDTPEATAADGIGMKYRRNVSTQPVVSHVQKLKDGKILTADGSGTVNNSTAANAVDLSYYDFVNKKMETDQYTANCYVISAPGWYKFPCVYGNAIEGTLNPSEASYKGLLLRANHLDRFKKMNDFSIYTRGAWLEKHGTLIVTNYHEYADLYWHEFTEWDSTNDVPVTAGKNLATNETVGTPFDVIKNVGMVDKDASQAYVQFYVDPDEIRPGNALIVTRERLGTSSHKITWSWHIWITDQNMTPVTVSNGTSSQDVLPVNLGWVDKSEGQYYDRRAEQIRFVNIADGAEQAVSPAVTVVQPAKEKISTEGWQTYYQWGRKDPFVESITSVQSGDHLLYQSILNPDKMFYEESTENGVHYYDWTSANYNNLWESKCNDYGQPADTPPNHKTVYDPSPRKFSISPDKTWDGFKTYGHEGSFEKGYHFYTSAAKDQTIFFPASGQIPYVSGTATINDHEVAGNYWTYHAVANTQTRMSYSLYFNSSGTVTPKNDVNTMRALGYSVRPVVYDELAIWPVDDGTTAVTLDFTEHWGTADQNDLRNVSVTFDTDIKITFDGAYLTRPQYAYDSSTGEGTVELHIGNDFIVSTTNTHKHIVSIELAISQEGDSSISTNVPTYQDGAWGDSSATTDYSTTPPTWTGGQSSVTFSLGVTGTRSWKISGITVYYYTD